MATGLPDWYSWVHVIQSMTFLELDDTPGTFHDQSGKVCRVDAGETALEFAELDDYLQPSDIGDIVQAWSTLLDWMTANVTAAGKALLDDVSAAAQATTLGLGTGDSPTFVKGTLSTGGPAAAALANTQYANNMIKAYVTFSGVLSVTIKDQFNITSVVRDSAGLYTVTIATDMAAESFGVFASISGLPAGSLARFVLCRVVDKSTFTIRLSNAADTANVDDDYISAFVIGHQ